jgi:hypothetical protein
MAALRNLDDQTPMECSGSEVMTPVECTGSENDVMMMDSPEISLMQPREDFYMRWSHSSRYFDEAFLMNDFGHAFDVYGRLWFRKDLKSPTTNHMAILRTEFDDPNLAEFSVCNTCCHSLNSKKIPLHAKTHGFRYSPKPRGLPNLDPVSERLISPRLPFMQIRRLRHEGSYGIVGQVINVPVYVNDMVRQLPRRLDNDYAFNVNVRTNSCTLLSAVLLHSKAYI